MGLATGKHADSRWKRPDSSDFPKTWHTFEAKDIDSDEFVHYRIEDIPELRYDEAVAMIVQHFCRDEPLCEAYGKDQLTFTTITKKN